jgi:DNA end-binding protein Ku
MKAIWKGAIGFGLVNIPVKLYSAVQQSELDLDMLDAKDHARIRFRRVNEDTGKEVPFERIVRGYDLNGTYVVVDKEDMERAAPDKTGMIAIQDFVAEEEVDSMLYETPYYVEPEKSGVQAYQLLREALRKSGKVGVATFVLRTRETAGVLRPVGNVLVLERLRYGEEIRDPGELNIPVKGKTTAGELKLAMELIGKRTGTFDIKHYRDTYTEALLKTIRAKAKGRKTAPVKMKVVHKKPTDLMAQLKASLDERKPATKRRKAS